MPEHVDYLQLASEVEDAALSAHDPRSGGKLSTTCRLLCCARRISQTGDQSSGSHRDIGGASAENRGRLFARFQSRASSYPRATQF